MNYTKRKHLKDCLRTRLKILKRLRYVKDGGDSKYRITRMIDKFIKNFINSVAYLRNVNSIFCIN